MELRSGVRVLATLATLTLCLLLCFLLLLLLAGGGEGATPETTVIVVNEVATGSVELGEYYGQKRGIPAGNIIALDLTVQEEINRTQYQELEAQLWDGLNESGLYDTVETLVLMYGVPLKVSDPYVPDAGTYDMKSPRASVDSELALMFVDKENRTYDNEGAFSNDSVVVNPYFNRSASFTRPQFDDMLLVARLDGPSPYTVRNLIERCIGPGFQIDEAKAYFDTDPAMDSVNLSKYDSKIFRAFDISLAHGIPSILETSNATIGDGDEVWSNESTLNVTSDKMAHPTIYWGWYSNESYYDKFNWTNQSAGQYVNSLNAENLSDEQQWCSGAIADGLSATTGHVYEPDSDAAAHPDIFVQALIDGHSVVEAFWMATPYLSWQNVVIGDPFNVMFPKPDLTIRNHNYTTHVLMGPNREPELFFQMEILNLGGELTGSFQVDITDHDFKPQGLAINVSWDPVGDTWLIEDTDGLWKNQTNRTDGAKIFQRDGLLYLSFSVVPDDIGLDIGTEEDHNEMVYYLSVDTSDQIKEQNEDNNFKYITITAVKEVVDEDDDEDDPSVGFASALLAVVVVAVAVVVVAVREMRKGSD